MYDALSLTTDHSEAHSTDRSVRALILKILESDNEIHMQSTLGYKSTGYRTGFNRLINRTRSDGPELDFLSFIDGVGDNPGN